MSDTDRGQLLELLKSQHDFPGSFTFKVICRNVPGITDRIEGAARTAVDLVAEPEPPKRRASTGDRFVSLTLDLTLRQAEDVLEVYRVLREQDDVISCF